MIFHVLFLFLCHLIAFNSDNHERNNISTDKGKSSIGIKANIDDRNEIRKMNLKGKMRKIIKVKPEKMYNQKFRWRPQWWRRIVSTLPSSSSSSFTLNEEEGTSIEPTPTIMNYWTRTTVASSTFTPISDFNE